MSRVAVALLWLCLAPVAAAAQYSRPYECTDCIGFWNYVAHGFQDYECLASTYPGHNGTDYVIRGGNAAIALGHKVIAARDGVVTVAIDGNRDDCTTCGGPGCGSGTPGGGFSNYVTLDHGGELTIYGHMRKGSIAVQVGQQVKCGDVLGEIGSAGCSTAAHLHFETQVGVGWGSYYDPYEGACNPGQASAWIDQGAHRGLPGLACDVQAPPPAAGCPNTIGAVWSCEGTDRVRCVADAVEREVCPLGCAPSPTGGAACTAPPVDADGDGVNDGADCNDLDPGVFPGALDVCGDGIDQNCDGADTPCPAPAPGVPPPPVPTAGAPAPVGVAGSGLYPPAPADDVPALGDPQNDRNLAMLTQGITAQRDAAPDAGGCRVTTPGASRPRAASGWLLLCAMLLFRRSPRFRR